MQTESVADTIVSLFCHRVAQSGPRTALFIPSGDGAYRQVTWNQLAADVQRQAAALSRLGLAPSDRVVQISENRYEWIVSDLAIVMAGGIHVPVHDALSGSQMAWQIADSGARLVLLSGESQAQKLFQSGVELRDGLGFLSYDDVSHLGGPWTIRPLHTILTDVSSEAMDHVQNQALTSVRSDHLASVLYSSGTTGEPRGVMLTHSNLVMNALGVVAAYNTTAEDLRLNWLPLSHIFARTCDLYTWIARGSQLALAESRERILANCGQIQPTIMNGVPYFFDRVYRHMVERGEEDTPGKLKELLGGRMRMCCSGAASLSDRTAEFFINQGVLLVQGYGLTETSPVITASSREHHKLGYVGLPISGVEIKISDDGEILTRGPHVMRGYWNNPEETQRVLRNGWLSTGDLGEIDEDGYLRVTGRKKDLIVTTTGNKVAPALLERLLAEHSLIEQALVVGEGRSYLAALVVPNPDALRSAIISGGIPVRSRDEALVHPQVMQLYRDAIDQQLASLGRSQQIGRFAILGRGFTVESGELTPSLKPRRHVISANCAELIESLYADPSQQPLVASAV